MTYQTENAVLVIPFRRPALFERTLRAVGAVRPRRLYVAQDAPRLHVAGETERCRETFALIDQLVDWPCEIFRHQAPHNLGGSIRVSSAISWLFENEERAIILEEDCVTHPTFFRFCDELLEHYANDERVAMISGNQFVPGGWPQTGASYSFARLAQIWGWASWRRAWKHFDYGMRHWPDERRKGDLLRRTFARRRDRRYWRINFDDIRDPGCWDYRWRFANWRHNQAAIVPCVNLSSNIGFGFGATHTVQSNHPAAAVPLVAMEFPLRHPARFVLDDALDRETTRILFSTGPIWFRIKCHALRWWGRLRALVGSK